ncbi:MAG: hypothetical protein CMP21_02830 [Rickettsiales bacterium]|nr:hypothetical protein [Rickettsiales bacterium]|tara:strand:- start:17512 stop:18645 length:1134 start_codon:yes stop_codon:yes gene_type:complete
MVTLLLIACNQERLLKEHLSTYKRLMDSIQGKIILVDDGSSDHTKEYVTTHFETISYMKNPVELGYCQSFNKVLAYIKTPYVLCIDLNIKVRFIPLQNALAYAQNNNLFMTSFPFVHQNKQFYGYYLAYKQFRLYFEETSLKPSCFCSEVMLFDTKRLQRLDGFSSHYHSTAFSWYDLIYRALKEGESIMISTNSLCDKKTSLSTFFSYLPDQNALLKDNFLFQWRFYRSFSFIFKRCISITLLFFSFNGSKILNFIQAYFQWLFFTKRHNSQILTSVKSFFKQLLTRGTSSFSVHQPILFTNHPNWDHSILKEPFSFKLLLTHIPAPIFIDPQSLSRLSYYSLIVVHKCCLLLRLKQPFHFVLSNYALEHELAYYS